MTASGGGFEPKAPLAAGNSINQTAAQRSRELGYADAMMEIWRMARDLEKVPAKMPDFARMIDPEAAFHLGVGYASHQIAMLGSFAYDAHWLHTLHSREMGQRLSWWRSYPDKDAPKELPEAP